MRNWIVGLLLLLSLPAAAVQKADLVLVDKTARTLSLISQGKAFATYRVVFGGNPVGHKQQEGDSRTPEGRYILDFKKPDSAFHMALHVSYPNGQDTAQAKARGVSAGGDIMVHGQKNGPDWPSFLKQRYNWTDGCIALTNAEIEEVWQAVDAGTPIEIRP